MNNKEIPDVNRMNYSSDEEYWKAKKEIPTAEELLEKYADKGDTISWDGTVEYMKEFANLHREAALQAAAENAETTWDSAHNVIVDKSSILNAYPADKIK